MRIAVLPWLVVALAACRPAADARPVIPTTAPALLRPGTYIWDLCRGVCRASGQRDVIRSGWLVLAETPLDLSTYPDAERSALDNVFMWERGSLPNGCYLLTATQPEAQTYAGLIGGGAAVRWQPPTQPSDTVRIATYRSPDAGHDIRIVGTPEGFAGWGHSWGFGIDKPNLTEDVVTGRYIGPPDLSRCRESARAAARSLGHAP